MQFLNSLHCYWYLCESRCFLLLILLLKNCNFVVFLLLMLLNVLLHFVDVLMNILRFKFLMLPVLLNTSLAKSAISILRSSLLVIKCTSWTLTCGHSLIPSKLVLSLMSEFSIIANTKGRLIILWNGLTTTHSFIDTFVTGKYWEILDLRDGNVNNPRFPNTPSPLMGKDLGVLLVSLFGFSRKWSWKFAPCLKNRNKGEILLNKGRLSSACVPVTGGPANLWGTEIT